MGRWAQAQRRGSVAPGETPSGSGPMAPTPGDWQLFQFSSIPDAEGGIRILSTPPPWAPDFGYRYRTPPGSGPWTTESGVTVPGPADFGAFDDAQTIEAQVRWENDDASLVSLWSASKTLEVG